MQSEFFKKLKLHEPLPTSCFSEYNFSCLKNSQVQINSKSNEKNGITYKHEKICMHFLMQFFAFKGTIFKVSRETFCHFMWFYWLRKVYSLSANHYPELWCLICTGVTLFALVFRLNCTALSQAESSNFFMYIISS